MLFVYVFLQKALCESVDILRDRHLPKCLPSDLPMYVLVLNKVIKLYKSEDRIKSFICTCLATLQPNGDQPGIVAEVINGFIKR